jgi:predicted NAD/FAD-binding protein
MHLSSQQPQKRLEIAVVGSGISGLGAAWLLSRRHAVTLFEAGPKIGGHSNTIDWEGTPVDTGFIVYNESTYPNLTALFRHLDVPTKASNMSFAASLDDGRLEYSGSDLFGLFAQRRNLLRPRFWAMLREILRFFRQAPRDLGSIGAATLDEYLDRSGYGPAMREDFLYPMAAAIWSTPAAEVGAYPAESFIRFFHNHGLLRAVGSPIWRTVAGGSQVYVERLRRGICGDVRVGRAVRTVQRGADGVTLIDASGAAQNFDHVVIAAHADQALRMLDDPTPRERECLGAFRYGDNHAVLHTDRSVMPKTRAAWASWNYTSLHSGDTRRLSVSYWMNRLQNIADRPPVFVTLNPVRDIPTAQIVHEQTYQHPLFDGAALKMQRQLWSLQGGRRTWYCGAYFGAGFHEDGLQAGLAVAEALGGVRRPWTVAGESDRVFLPEREPQLVFA